MITSALNAMAMGRATCLLTAPVARNGGTFGGLRRVSRRACQPPVDVARLI